jgi:hypothetical protein
MILSTLPIWLVLHPSCHSNFTAQSIPPLWIVSSYLGSIILQAGLRTCYRTCSLVCISGLSNCGRSSPSLLQAIWSPGIYLLVEPPTGWRKICDFFARVILGLRHNPLLLPSVTTREFSSKRIAILESENLRGDSLQLGVHNDFSEVFLCS